MTQTDTYMSTTITTTGPRGILKSWKASELCVIKPNDTFQGFFNKQTNLVYPLLSSALHVQYDYIGLDCSDSSLNTIINYANGSY